MRCKDEYRPGSTVYIIGRNESPHRWECYYETTSLADAQICFRYTLDTLASPTEIFLAEEPPSGALREVPQQDICLPPIREIAEILERSTPWRN